MKLCKLRVIFQSNNRLKNCFQDVSAETLRSSLIYKFLKISWEAAQPPALVGPIDILK